VNERLSQRVPSTGGDARQGENAGRLPGQQPEFLKKFHNNQEHRIMMKFAKQFLPARRTLLMAAVLATTSCALWAQSDQAQPGGGMRGGGPNVDRQLGQLTQALTLTADQQTQVKALLEQRRGKMEALRASGTQPTREQMEGIRKDTDAKITALLSDDQKTKYAAWQQERMERRRGGGGGDGVPPPPPPPPPPGA
jgi:Spy/CpxP family protein refolding chaperone